MPHDGDGVSNGSEVITEVDNNLDNLFGDDSESEFKEQDDLNEENEQQSFTKNTSNISDNDNDKAESLNYNPDFHGDPDDDDSDEENSPKEFKEVNIEIVKRVVPYQINSSNKQEDNVLYYAKVPRFLTIDPIPFDPLNFRNILESRESQNLSKEEQLGNILIDENTVRWRYSRDYNKQVFKESNAQIIKWSDDTFSLKLGDEFTDILINNTNNTFLAVSHEEQELMQCAESGEITKTMMFIPTSTNSKIHQRLSKAVTKREEIDKKGPDTYIAHRDPELEQKELERKQFQIIRERRKRQIKEQQESEYPDFGRPMSMRKSQENGMFNKRNHDEYEEDDFLVDNDDDNEGELSDNEEGYLSDKLNAERLKQLKKNGIDNYSATNETKKNESNIDHDSVEKDEEHVTKRRKITVLDDEDE